MVYIIICILFVIASISIWGWISLFKKYERLELIHTNKEDIIIEMINRIKDINNRINDIDYKGHFKADDEVGFFFNEMKDMTASLMQFVELEEIEIENFEPNKTKSIMKS